MSQEHHDAVVFSHKGVLQGYRYWAGIGVLQSCESALTHYRLVANHGTYLVFYLSCSRKKYIILSICILVVVVQILQMTLN